MKIHQRSLLHRLGSPILKTLGISAALYLFICSLTFLSTAFRILGGRNLSNLFQNSQILSNPIVGIMIGILVTVAVQSSATSTSIIVALVSAGAPVKNTIPILSPALFKPFPQQGWILVQKHIENSDLQNVECS